MLMSNEIISNFKALMSLSTNVLMVLSWFAVKIVGAQ